MTKEIREGLGKPSEQYRQWQRMSPEEKRRQLFLNQKQTLDAFVQRHAISRDEYERSLGILRQQMGIAS